MLSTLPSFQYHKSLIFSFVMLIRMADYQSKSVVTVGTRATLPSIYVENETSGNSGGATSLRYRNRIQDDDLNNNDRMKYKSLESPEVASLGSSIRSSPSYGTPGTTARWVVM